MSWLEWHFKILGVKILSWVVVAGIVLVSLLVIAIMFGGCSQAKPPVLMTPGSKLIYHDGTHGMWTICDRGNRVYMTHSGVIQVVAGACPTGDP
jgi:hypothetical protein